MTEIDQILKLSSDNADLRAEIAILKAAINREKKYLQEMEKSLKDAQATLND